MKEMTIQEVHQVSLDVLQEFHDFCVNNNIHYSLSGGSLIGAIRHNGFIPWDDDIDVQMPRPDYEKFIHTYTSHSGFELCCRELPDYEKKMGYPYARLCDTKRTFVDMGTKPWIQKQLGIWIDILPCDGMPSDEKLAKKHLRINWLWEKQAFWSGTRYIPWSYIVKAKNLNEKAKFIVKKILSMIIRVSSFEPIYRVKTKYDYNTSEYFFAIPHYGMREWQPKKNMESFQLHKFEDREFMIMSGFDANLTSLFGDYMKLPPEDKRISHDFNKYYWKR